MIKAKKDEHNIVSLKVIKKRILPMSNVRSLPFYPAPTSRALTKYDKGKKG